MMTCTVKARIDVDPWRDQDKVLPADRRHMSLRSVITKLLSGANAETTTLKTLRKGAEAVVRLGSQSIM